jgi:hypothetical protein
MAWSKGVKGLFKWQAMKQPKLAQLDKVLYKWFSNAFQRETHDWAYDIWQSWVFFDGMKIPDNCTFSMAGCEI